MSTNPTPVYIHRPNRSIDRAPYQWNAIEWSEHGTQGWYVSILEKDRYGELSSLTEEAMDEIRNWLKDAVGWDIDTVDANVYCWGVTFARKSDALLCYMRFRQ